MLKTQGTSRSSTMGSEPLLAGSLGDPYNEYSYDDLDRLTDVTYHDSETEAFVMDALGNRTGNQTLRDDGTVNFTVDSATNRYTAIGGSSISHDEAGNLTVDKDGYQYTYDYENRVVKIVAEQETLIAEFDYDAQGRRMRVYDAVADTTTLYYYSDNWQVLAEYDDAGNQQAYYVYGNYIDEVLLMRRDGSDKYYLHDHLYSPAALLDASGNVVERYEYDAYGTTHIMDASYNSRSASLYDNPYGFQGHRFDMLDGGNLLRTHCRHRDYDSYAASWLQNDEYGMIPNEPTHTNPFNPISQYWPGANLRVAFHLNPLANLDPYGLWGSLIHLTKTRVWAQRVGYPHQAASTVAQADEAVDSGDTSFWPWAGPEYHFNRSGSAGEDSRLRLADEHLTQARVLCLPAFDMPFTAARQLGTSLHPLQDWVAHGDYGLNEWPHILTHHNSQSPQNEFGPPGYYPDDPTLDVVSSPDGRATKEYIVDSLIIGGGTYFDVYRDFAYYEKGFKRYNLTREKTKTVLEYYREFVRRYGGCRCKRFFGVEGNP